MANPYREKIELLSKSLEISHIGSWIYHLSGTITWTDETYRIYGLSKDSFKPNAESFINLIHPKDRNSMQVWIANCFSGKKISELIFRIIFPDGSLRYLRGLGMLQYDTDNKPLYLAGTVQDITDQKNAEEKTIIISRLYHFISQINQMIVRTTDEKTLFKEVCEIAIDFGKFRMAWIGLIDEKTKKVIPVIHAGYEHDYLSKINTISVSDEPEGRGPTGTAIREGKYMVCNDIENDPQMAPWKTEALNRDYHSSISLPIKKSGNVIGAFSLYASQAFFFNDQEINLLKEVTRDISFALDIFEKTKQHKKYEEALQENEIKFRTVFEHSVNAIGVSKLGIHVLVNSAYLALFGYQHNDELIGKPILDLIAPNEREKILNYVKLRSKAEFVPSAYETKGLRKNGSAFDMDVHVSDYKLNGETYTLVILWDITERKKAEEALIEKEHTLSEAQRIAHIGSWKSEMDGRRIWSDETYRIYGVSPDSFVPTTESLMTVIYPEDRKIMHDWIEQCASGKKPGQFEFRIFYPDGTIRNLIGRGELKCDAENKPLYMSGTVQDITEQKKTEMEILQMNEHLRNLSSRLQNIREEERMHIAREIHDELGQQLTALKNEAAWIGKKLTSSDNAVQEKLSDVMLIIDHALLTVRRISQELRPSILDDFGLIAALESYSQEFSRRNGIKINFNTEMDELDFEKNTSIHVFRIYQESLTNIARHANASHIETTLEEKNGFIYLTIKDNGKGFEVHEEKKKNSLGLIGMKERALLFQGELTIQSEKRKGTIITLKIPLIKK